MSVPLTEPLESFGLLTQGCKGVECKCVTEHYELYVDTILLYVLYILSGMKVNLDINFQVRISNKV